MNDLNLTTLTLRRTESDDKRTLGEIRVTDRDIVCYTLELPYRDNQQGISCIPCGTYVVTPHWSPSKGNVFKVWNVPDRENVLIHIGNIPINTKGCILVGLDQTPHDVGQSRLALEKFQEMFRDEAFKLIITDDDMRRG